MTKPLPDSDVVFGRLRRAYVVVAVVVLNTTVLLIGLNVAAVTLFAINESLRPGNPVIAFTRSYGISVESLTPLYPGLSVPNIGDLFRETWVDNPMVYEPFTLFKERPRVGKYVNVHPGGFRVSANQGPWPPDRSQYLTVFVFGGSTTFGYGVNDDETVVSHLQRDLDAQAASKPIRLYNFGRGFYFLSQERILFQQLLSAGFVPDAALFIDGLNDFAYYSGEPAGAGQFHMAFAAGRTMTANLKAVLRALPVTRLVLRAIERFGLAARSERDIAASAGIATGTTDDMVRGVIRRYLEDKKLIEVLAASHAVPVSFVWQPVPTYKHDLKYYLFAKGGFGVHALSGLGYPAMASVAPAGANFIWCADIQIGLSEPLYVDKVHYSPRMGGRLARCIADGMKKADAARSHGSAIRN